VKIEAAIEAKIGVARMGKLEIDVTMDLDIEAELRVKFETDGIMRQMVGVKLEEDVLSEDLVAAEVRLNRMGEVGLKYHRDTQEPLLGEEDQREHELAKMEIGAQWKSSWPIAATCREKEWSFSRPAVPVKRDR